MNSIKLDATRFGHRQQGFVLLTALVFMIVLTVILLSMVNISTSDEKIARNSRDKDIAFAAAEAALRDAEIYISGSYQFPYAPNINPNSYPSQQMVSQSSGSPEQSDFFNTSDANYAYTCAIGGNGVGSNGMGCSPANTNITHAPQIVGVNAQPRYLIDIVPYNGTACNNQSFLFRITVQAEGRSADTRVTLQEFYCPP